MNSERRLFPILLVVVIIILLFLTRYVPAESPTNLEPILGIDSITNITRNEATVNVDIRHRGPKMLEHIFLCYAPTGDAPRGGESAQFASVEITPAASAVRLTGLRAGTTYSCRVEGGTATAAFVSANADFSTIHNTVPRISECDILSQGPTSVILEVEILDNGGDAIESVAFTHTNMRTGKTVEHLVSNPDLSQSAKVRVVIRDLTPGSRYSFSYGAGNRNGTTHGIPFELETGTAYMVDAPGSLRLLIDADAPFSEKNITIHGPLESADIALLRRLLLAPDAVSESGATSGLTSALEELDLAECTITPGIRTYDGEHFTVANEVTVGMFANCPQLRAIRLPNSVTHVRRDAFSGSTNLERIEIGAENASIEVSQNCTSLKAIEVSKANRLYRSIDGVLFNADATAIQWMPLGKTDPLHLPESITSIGELAFAGSRIEKWVTCKSLC